MGRMAPLGGPSAAEGAVGRLRGASPSRRGHEAEERAVNDVRSASSGSPPSVGRGVEEDQTAAPSASSYDQLGEGSYLLKKCGHTAPKHYRCW